MGTPGPGGADTSMQPSRTVLVGSVVTCSLARCPGRLFTLTEFAETADSCEPSAEVGHIHPWVALLCPPGPTPSRLTKPRSQGCGTGESGAASARVPSARFPRPKHARSGWRTGNQPPSLPSTAGSHGEGHSHRQGSLTKPASHSGTAPSAVRTLKKSKSFPKAMPSGGGCQGPERLGRPRYPHPVPPGIVRADRPAALELDLRRGPPSRCCCHL